MHSRDFFIRQPLFGTKSVSIFENLLILLFLCLGLFGILHHEMWRDELQAWLLARDSFSTTNLYENLKHEGHPALWHLCLYWISRWTHNPVAMQIFHVLVATGTIGLLIKFSPFSLVQKGLLAFGYFFFYEYSIVSRNYGIGILLIFVFCTLFAQRKSQYVLMSVVLALLANANVYALLLSITLALTMVLEAIASKKILLTKKKWHLVVGFLITVAGWGISILQISRPLRSLSLLRPVASIKKDTVWEENLIQEIEKFANVLGNVCESYIPIPDVYKQKYWDTTIFDSRNVFPHLAGYSTGSFLTYVISIAILIIVARVLINKPTILFTYAFGTLSFISFGYLIHDARVRHYGHYFILLIACLWLAQYTSFRQPPPRQNRKLRTVGQALFTLMLVLHVAASAYVYSMDLKYPFSTSKVTADFIQNRGYQDLPIVGATYRKASTLSGYLDRPIYYLTDYKFGSYWQDQQKEEQGTEVVLQAARNLFEEGNSEVLLVLNYELESEPIITFDLRVEQLAQFKGGVVHYEDFNVYLARQILPE